MDLSEKLTKLKSDHGLTTEMLAALSGVPRGTINKILNGETQNPTARTLGQLARALGCTPGALYAGNGESAHELRENPLPPYENILPVTRRRIPILGTISAGVPIYDNGERDLFSANDEPFECDFLLRIKGSSMIGARIYDGDLVFIKKQPDVNDGQIAAVVIEGEATLKRVYHVRDGITLVAENSEYPPVVVTGAERESIHILGRAVGFQSRL